MSKCHNFIPKFQGQHHIKTSQNSSKSELKARQKHTYSWSAFWHETTSQKIGLQGQDYHKKGLQRPRKIFKQKCTQKLTQMH
jgi:hypothetical protein